MSGASIGMESQRRVVFIRERAAAVIFFSSAKISKPK